MARSQTTAEASHELNGPGSRLGRTMQRRKFRAVSVILLQVTQISVAANVCARCNDDNSRLAPPPSRLKIIVKRICPLEVLVQQMLHVLLAKLHPSRY